MSDSAITSFVESVRSATDVNAHYAQIDRWITSGNIDFLCETAKVLVPLSGTRWTFDSVLEHIVSSLALNRGIRSAKAAVTIYARRFDSAPASGEMDHAYAAHLASLLSSAQDPSVLRDLIVNAGAAPHMVDIASRILQEMVVRGNPCNKDVVLTNFQRTLQDSGHSLAWLPLSLTDIETELSIKRYEPRSISWSVPSAPLVAGPADLDSETSPTISVEETTTTDYTQCASAAVIGWTKKSNGVVEARTFRAGIQLDFPTVKSLFPHLGLASLQGLRKETLKVETILPSKVFAILFAAAAHGGAYGGAAGHAWGRLLAWKALGGLTGSSESAPVDAILRDAKDCLWIQFHASTDWFYGIAWDIGIVSIRSDRREIALLAATDQD
jgi:hypothetical protein